MNLLIIRSFLIKYFNANLKISYSAINFQNFTPRHCHRL